MLALAILATFVVSEVHAQSVYAQPDFTYTGCAEVDLNEFSVHKDICSAQECQKRCSGFAAAGVFIDGCRCAPSLGAVNVKNEVVCNHACNGDAVLYGWCGSDSAGCEHVGNLYTAVPKPEEPGAPATPTCRVCEEGKPTAEPEYTPGPETAPGPVSPTSGHEAHSTYGNDVPPVESSIHTFEPPPSTPSTADYLPPSPSAESPTAGSSLDYSAPGSSAEYGPSTLSTVSTPDSPSPTSSEPSADTASESTTAAMTTPTEPSAPLEEAGAKAMAGVLSGTRVFLGIALALAVTAM